MDSSKAKNIWEMSDLRTPWCLFVAVTLRVADNIFAGIDTIEELSDSAQCDRSVLQSILGHLVSQGVFEEPEPGRYRLNDTSRQLLDPITKASLDLEGIGGRFAQAWGTLLQLARTGKPAYESVFGMTFWDDLEAHPQLAASFDALIGPPGHGTPDPEFKITGGWDSIRTVVDVGGGTGAMLAEILRTKPHLKGILVDLPRTVARSQELFQAAGVRDRVQSVGQSFFDPLPSGADLYLLRGVINDWPDQETLAILRTCAQAAHPAGRVVVLKSVGPDDARRDLTVEMVLLGGKHRTLTEFRLLAREAGLEVIAYGQQPAYYVVECLPVSKQADR